MEKLVTFITFDKEGHAASQRSGPGTIRATIGTPILEADTAGRVMVMAVPAGAEPPIPEPALALLSPEEIRTLENLPDVDTFHSWNHTAAFL